MLWKPFPTESVLYSRLFLEEKASGGWRPVIDLSFFNTYVQMIKFKMEIIPSVLAFIKKGDHILSGLEGWYFQIAIHADSRQHLHFRLKGMTLHFKDLCFDLSPGLHQSVHSGLNMGLSVRHLPPYCLDDWLVIAYSVLHLRENQLLLELRTDLDSVIIWEKRDLKLKTGYQYLGLLVDTVQKSVYPVNSHIIRF